MTRSNPDKRHLRIGLILNPIAGIGGSVALKGSDGVLAAARARGGESKVAARVGVCLQKILQSGSRVEWLTMPGEMGADLLQDALHSFQQNSLQQNQQQTPCQNPSRFLGIVGEIQQGATTAEDTRRGCMLLEERGVDLLLFAGGDGTARDLVDVHSSIPAFLGIPCGVKMHSGVFATTPSTAAEIVIKLARDETLSVVAREVRDINEEACREGVMRTRFYGELPVPDELRYVQHTKMAGREDEALAIEEIAASIIDDIEPGILYLMGSGSTVAAIMASMQLDNTLLGVDAVCDYKLVASDVTEQQLWELLSDARPARILVSVIGGQGYIFGRGNQQFSPRIIRRVGRSNIIVIATRTKLAALNAMPLLVDTGDESLDTALAGLHSIRTGYEDAVLYRVSQGALE